MLHSHHHIPHPRRHRAWVVLALILAPFFGMLIAGHFAGVSGSGLLTALLTSLYRLILAYLLSLIIAVVVAIAVGSNRTATTIFLPIFDVLQNIPSFALTPIFIILLGLTDTMVIVFAATSIIWPILFYTLNAVETAHSDLNDAATVFGATGLKRAIYYLLPLSFPAIVTGSIVGVSIGWEAVIGMEIIGSITGVGTFLNIAGANHDKPALIAGTIAILCLVFIINRAVWVPLISRTQKYAE